MVGAGTVGVHSSLQLFAPEGYQACLLRATRTQPNKATQSHATLLTPIGISWGRFARTQFADIKMGGQLSNAENAADS